MPLFNSLSSHSPLSTLSTSPPSTLFTLHLVHLSTLPSPPAASAAPGAPSSPFHLPTLHLSTRLILSTLRTLHSPTPIHSLSTTTNHPRNETLRIHSTSSIGLPRVVPPGPGVNILNHHFPPLTVLSVPAYTIHHSTSIWGPDANEFKPDRWAEGVLTDKQKAAFIPFSYGPRACVGRNVAEMELAMIASTVVKGFEFELREGELETREGFLRKPLRCRVGMRRRRWES